MLVTEEGVPLTGENIYQHLNQMKTPGFTVLQLSLVINNVSGPVCVYPRDSEMKAKVEGFQRKLDQV